jgi:3-dehydroquinate synthase
LSNYELRHGEAVAVGIALDTVYSRLVGLLDSPSTERVLRLLERLGFNLYVQELKKASATGRWAILEGLEEFRQHLGGRLTISLIKQIGRESPVHVMKAPLIIKAIGELCCRHDRVRD